MLGWKHGRDQSEQFRHRPAYFPTICIKYASLKQNHMENKLAISTASACTPSTVACRLREEFVTSYLHIAAVEDLAAIPRLAHLQH